MFFAKKLNSIKKNMYLYGKDESKYKKIKYELKCDYYEEEKRVTCLVACGKQHGHPRTRERAER